ncbi:hypothetical protein K1X13_09785 [Nocardioides sp. WL0053]|uniref:Antibiotic biosynthesis monooxygenase n=1 Tax=Nocardioides jiangsuensis TaxID=2866161 RepID=A0ABS7RJ87_9ACTN|nr:hypothetical protein [Nocardioides jiangsuensis]MBY9075109.1 hypothetical protein [Nocardioides jiangsuensis]
MFIQIIQGKCSRQDELRAAADRWRTEIGDSAEGWLGGTYGFTDDDMFMGVVRFASREAAMANSNRPEQTQWWSEVEQLFDGPVEFHDCDKVMLMMEGGSDTAGFVQIIRGKLDDPARLEADLDQMTSLIHEARPEILGATFAIEEDGTFTETVAFTDEAAAREGEAKEMPLNEDVRHVWQDWEQITHDVTYMDLHHPWFASRP